MDPCRSGRELVSLISAPQPPAVPTETYTEPADTTASATQCTTIAQHEPTTTVVAGQPAVYAPANAIPAGYVAIAPA